MGRGRAGDGGRAVCAGRLGVVPPRPGARGAGAVPHRDRVPGRAIVVADKPHFLATTPRGSHVTETALARLRRELNLPALGPAHRLDRLTSGLVLFVVRPEERGAYQTTVPRQARTQGVRGGGRPRPGNRAAADRAQPDREGARGAGRARSTRRGAERESRIELVGHRGGLGRYRLLPHTGRTHQLRVHMNALGLPILGDPIYPAILDEVAPDDFRRPLQLLARTLEFRDPVTGRSTDSRAGGCSRPGRRTRSGRRRRRRRPRTPRNACARPGQ